MEDSPRSGPEPWSRSWEAGFGCMVVGELALSLCSTHSLHQYALLLPKESLCINKEVYARLGNKRFSYAFQINKLIDVI